MLRLCELGRPARGDDEQPHVVDAVRQVPNQVGRGRIRPVQVVETQHDGVHARDFLQQRGNLPLEAFLRPDRDVSREARGR